MGLSLCARMPLKGFCTDQMLFIEVADSTKFQTARPTERGQNCARAKKKSFRHSDTEGKARFRKVRFPTRWRPSAQRLTEFLPSAPSLGRNHDCLSGRDALRYCQNLPLDNLQEKA